MLRYIASVAAIPVLALFVTGCGPSDGTVDAVSSTTVNTVPTVSNSANPVNSSSPLENVAGFIGPFRESETPSSSVVPYLKAIAAGLENVSDINRMIVQTGMNGSYSATSFGLNLSVDGYVFSLTPVGVQWGNTSNMTAGTDWQYTIQATSGPATVPSMSTVATLANDIKEDLNALSAEASAPLNATQSYARTMIQNGDWNKYGQMIQVDFQNVATQDKLSTVSQMTPGQTAYINGTQLNFKSWNLDTNVGSNEFAGLTSYYQWISSLITTGNTAPSSPVQTAQPQSPSLTYTTTTSGYDIVLHFHHMGAYTPSQLEMDTPQNDPDTATVTNGQITPLISGWRFDSNGNIEYVFHNFQYGSNVTVKVICTNPGTDPVTLSLSYQVPN